jgi:hypothetical protein
MRKAFDINTGPLTNQNLPEAERPAPQRRYSVCIRSMRKYATAVIPKPTKTEKTA